MGERDIFELAETRLSEHGFEGWYHPPEVCIGEEIGASPVSAAAIGSALGLSRRKLAPGDLISIDIGPASGEAYGDIATTLLFGGGVEPKILAVARECVRASCGYASRWKTVGEIFVFATAWAVNNRMELASHGNVGHRVLPREGLLATGFPRSAYLATRLARNRIHRLNPVRMAGMFAIRPVVKHGELAAGFEEMIYIQDEHRIVLGREGLTDIAS